VSESHAEQPEWLAAWQDDPRSRLPQQVGNPNWRRGGPSPNPKGRPPGQSKQTKLIQRMLDDAGGILDAMIARALEGDTSAAGLVLSRVLPALRSQSEKVAFDFDPSLPIGRQGEQVLQAISEGAVAPDTGKLIIEAIQALSSIRAVEELEARLAALEAKAA
jgi:hypothetical protein